MTEQDKKIVLDWDTDYDPENDEGGPISCTFEIDFENKKILEIIDEIYEFLKIKREEELKSLFRIEKNELDKKIIWKVIGRGEDGRCSLCRAFRTRLRNVLKEKEINLLQPSLCLFDKEGSYGIDILELLNKKIKSFEEGLDEESSEEDYFRWIKYRSEVIQERNILDKRANLEKNDKSLE